MLRKIFITLLMVFTCSILSFAQPKMARPFIDFSKYEKVDSLPLEMIMVHFNNEIDDADAISMGDGDYLVKVPYNDKILIRKTVDGTKAIVLYNSYCFGRHFEFNVEDSERRTILWYRDKRIYCGYIYDKKFKVCKYFESKKEYKRFMRYK